MLLQNFGEIVPFPQQQGPLLEISYVLLFPVMAPHYHRLYQISSLEAEV